MRSVGRDTRFVYLQSRKCLQRHFQSGNSKDTTDKGTGFVFLQTRKCLHFKSGNSKDATDKGTRFVFLQPRRCLQRHFQIGIQKTR